MYCKTSNPLYYLFYVLILINIGVSQIDDSQNCEMVKLSYIKSDYAIGVLKALGHNVIEFESMAGETKTEFSFSPTSILDKNKLTIIKMPENNSVSLSSLSTNNNNDDDDSGESIAASLGGSSFSNTSSGEPLQRLMACYPTNQFEAFSKFYQFLKNEIDVAADQILIEALVIEIDSEKLNEIDLGLTDYTASNTGNDHNGKLLAAISGAAVYNSDYGFQARNEEEVTSTFYYIRVKNADYNFRNNPTFTTGSLGALQHASMLNDPKTYITTVGMYNDKQELLATAKLSKPLLKSFDREALIKVKLDF